VRSFLGYRGDGFPADRLRTRNGYRKRTLPPKAGNCRLQRKARRSNPHHPNTDVLQRINQRLLDCAILPMPIDNDICHVQQMSQS
jgi:hypothetical protein